MTTESAHRDRLRELFREEAREHFEAIRRRLGGAEGSDSRIRALKEALRAAHSVKGGATISGLSRLGTLMHNWESCASAVVGGRAEPDDATLDILVRAIDAASDELDAKTGAAGGERLDAARTAAELAAHFGELAELRAIEPEDELEAAETERGAPEGTVRIATSKLDRQMASVEELLRLKVSGEDRLASLSHCLAAFETARLGIADARRLSRSALGNGASGGDGRKVLDALDGISKSLGELHGRLSAVLAETRQATHALSTLADSLHADVRSIRMLPVETMLAPFGRMVRDLARTTGKRVRLELAGGATEVDRDVLEAIKDPVMHLLRNAVDHGIEGPTERELVGKTLESVVRVRASSGGGMLDIEIEDDGRGIVAEDVRRVAEKRGLLSADQLSKLDDSLVLGLVFQEGFSTAREVTDLSGRGVGLAVVRTQVERASGRVSVSSTLGKGTCFKLTLPLNLATARFVLVQASGEVFAIPALSVERVVRVPVEALVRVDHGMAFELDGRPVPIPRLSDSLGLSADGAPEERLVALVLGTSPECEAFAVDRIVDERELVARGLGDHLRAVGCINGVAILPDGAVAPILNAAELLRGAAGERAPRTSFERRRANETRVQRRLLVVDDSVTTRTLEKSILEAAGYHVSVAVDGLEALDQLGRASFDLVLSDVQMPRMDGLTLVRSIKQDARFSELPVVLVSSLDSAEQKKQGLDAGADAYLSKGEFEQGILLATLGRFL